MDLNQVTILSNDLQKSVAFYKTLGLRLIVDSVPRYARFECPVGSTTFSIHHTDNPPLGEGTIVYFECDDLEKRVSELTQQGIQFDLQPTEQSWLWKEAHLRDPDGNRIILFYAGENRKNPPWRVDA